MAPIFMIPGPAPASFDSAIAQLENTERELVEFGKHVAVRLDATRLALSSLRGVRAGVPDGSARRLRKSKPGPRPRAASEPVVAETRRRRGGQPHSSPTEADARRVLAGGPVAPGAFARALGVSRYLADQLTDGLVSRSIVTVTGATSGKRIALAGRPAAKEAP